MQNGTQKGLIKRLVRERGFGFLTGEDGRSYFFHKSDVEGSFHALEEEQPVKFEVEPDAPKGPRARRVIAASNAADPTADGWHPEPAT